MLTARAPSFTAIACVEAIQYNLFLFHALTCCSGPKVEHTPAGNPLESGAPLSCIATRLGGPEDVKRLRCIGLLVPSGQESAVPGGVAGCCILASAARRAANETVRKARVSPRLHKKCILLCCRVYCCSLMYWRIGVAVGDEASASAQIDSDILLAFHDLQVSDCTDVDASLLSRSFLRLEELHLRDSVRLTAAGWAALAQLPRLSCLRLDSPRETDISCIGSQFNGLSALKFYGSVPDSGAVATALVRLRGLRALTINGLQSDDGADFLALHTDLQHLFVFVSSRGVTDATIERLLRLPLHTFGLIHAAAHGISDVSMDLLCRLSLTHLCLRLKSSTITRAGAMQLSKLQRLSFLEVSGDWVSDGFLSEASRLCSLTRMVLDDCPSLTYNGLASLSRLVSLRDLTLQDLVVTNDGLEVLRGLSSLQRLDLHLDYITEVGLYKTIPHLPGLTSLTITGDIFHSLSCICRATGLQDLTIISDNAVICIEPYLWRMKLLRRLTVRCAMARTCAIWKAIGRSHTLTHLDLGRSNVSGIVNELLRMPCLRELRIGPLINVAPAVRARLKHILVDDASDWPPQLAG